MPAFLLSQLRKMEKLAEELPLKAGSFTFLIAIMSLPVSALGINIENTG